MSNPAAKTAKVRVKPAAPRKPPLAADKSAFFNLLNRAARSSAEPSAKTSGKKTSGD